MTDGQREIPLFTLEGVPDVQTSVVPFTTRDGIGLSLVRFRRGPADEVVLITHGLTSSTDMFIMPEHDNLVTDLLDHGYGDVWCLDTRMSNRHPYNLTRHRYTLDDVALYDVPAAVGVIREHVGARPLHAIAHCLGAAAVAMAVFGRLVDDQLASLTANSAGLVLRVPGWSKVKLALAPAIIDTILHGRLNPRWSEDPGFTLGELVSRVTSLLHPECSVPACHMLSLMWGTGWPALYEHDNLDPVTHRRVADLFGATSMHYYRHVRRIVRAGEAVKYDPGDPAYDALPDRYLQHAADVETPVLWMTGDRNRVFADSNVACHARMQQLAPGRDELAVLEGYGHQDAFMGRDVARDVFPRIRAFLDRQRGGDRPSASPRQTARGERPA